MEDDLIAFNVKLPRKLIKKLKVRAAQEEKTVQALTLEAIEAGLKVTQ